MVEIGANVARLQSDMQKGMRHIDDFSKQASSALNLVKLAAGAVGGYFTFQGAVSAIKSVTAAAEESETVARKLRVTLESQGYQAQALTSIYQEYARQIQQTTAYTDEQAMATMGMLTVFGVAPNKIQAVTKAALDLSTLYGGDLEKATRQVAQAMNGQFRELARMIPELKNLKGNAFDAVKVLELIEQRVGPQAQAEMQSYTGQIKQMANEWDEVKETIGRSVVPVLRDSVLFIKDLVAEVQRLMGMEDATMKQIRINAMKYQIARAEVYKNLAPMEKAGMRLEGYNPIPDSYLRILKEKVALEATSLKNETAYQSAVKKFSSEHMPVKPPPPVAGGAKPSKANIDKSDILSINELRELWIKSEGERFQEATEFNEKWAADYKKSAEDAYSSIAKWDYDFTENFRKNADDRLIVTADEWERRNSLIIDALGIQAKIYEENWAALSEAVQTTNTPGLSTMLSGLKMLEDLELQKDAYSQTLDLAWEHYGTMLDAAKTYHEFMALETTAYNKLMIMETQRADMARWQSYAAYAQLMMGGMEALATFADKNSKAMFLVSKAVAIAMILIQGHIAAMSAAAAVAGIPIVGPELAAAAYAKWMGITYATAGMAAAVAIGQASGMGAAKGKGNLPKSAASSITAGQKELIGATKESQRGQTINFYIYGNVYDEKKLARELQPYLTQAQNDGVQ